MDSEPRFYVLDSAHHGSHETAALPGDGFETGDFPRCPRCGGAIGMREWLPPYRVEIAVRGEAGAGDLVRMTGGDYLVSDRMVTAIRSEGLTGLTGFQPVEIVKMNARAKRLGLPKYLRVEATFGRAAVDEARSRLRRTEPVECDECRNTGLDGIYGFRLQRGTWDGLDVFRPRGLQTDGVVTERFADFVKRHGFTNISLVPTEQFLWDPRRKGPPAETVRA